MLQERSKCTQFLKKWWVTPQWGSMWSLTLLRLTLSDEKWPWIGPPSSPRLSRYQRARSSKPGVLWCLREPQRERVGRTVESMHFIEASQKRHLMSCSKEGIGIYNLRDTHITTEFLWPRCLGLNKGAAHNFECGLLRHNMASIMPIPWHESKWRSNSTPCLMSYVNSFVALMH